MKIELTPSEANTLIDLLDLAVKSSGLANAETALYFTQKITSAAHLEEKEKIKAELKEEILKKNNLTVVKD